ncbi:MAG: M20/M25/M40 family metallo-hydrolase [Armatimonadota bacterium]
MIDTKRLLDTFLGLAAINSPSGKEGEVASILEAELKILGFDVIRDDAGSKGKSDTGNLIAKKKGSMPNATPIMFSAHMDTVADTTGWGYVIEDGIIRTNGKTILGADDKAGIAAILEALRSVSETGMSHGDIEVVFSISEEIGLVGARYLDPNSVTSRCCFIFDIGKPVGGIAFAAPSHDNLKVIIHGKAAHSGANPEDGVNAVVVASKAIANMKIGRIDKETTANIGVISGGTARNIVPDYCEVRGEARSRNDEKLGAQVQHMVDAFHQAAAEMGATVDIEVERSYQSYRLTENDEVVRIALEAARKAGIEPDMHETGGGSDANILNARGIPSVPVGVGYDQPHSVDEHMAINDLVKAAEMAVAIIQVASGQ